MARCESASASIVYAPRCSSILRTTVLPVPIFPVRPMTYFPGQWFTATSIQPWSARIFYIKNLGFNVDAPPAPVYDEAASGRLGDRGRASCVVEESPYSAGHGAGEI